MPTEELMTATPSSTELEAQIDDLRQRHEAAIQRVDAARDARQEAAGRRVLGEADEEELAAAQAALSDAEDVASSLASALALVETRLTEAKERDRTEAIAAAGERAASLAQSRTKALGRLDRALGNVALALKEIGECDGAYAGEQTTITELLDAKGREEAVEERFRAKWEQLIAEGQRRGLVPNEATVEFQLEAALKALRERLAEELAQIAQPTDSTDVDAVLAKHAAVLPAIADPALRTILSQGHEFITRPQASFSVYGGGAQTSVRVYGQGEYGLAEKRHGAFLDALRKLAGGPALTIAQEQARKMAAMNVPAGGQAYSLGGSEAH